LGAWQVWRALAGGSLGIKNPNDMFIGMFKSRTVEKRHGASILA